MPGEPEGTLRAELLEQIGAAQAALEAQLDQLQHAANQGGSTAALVIAQNQLSRLGGLGQTIEHARGVSLASIRAEVTAVVAATLATVQQARAAAAGGQAAELALHEAQAEAHRTTGDFLRDFYERRIFDKHLHFASTEDERAYREREEARQKEIEKARAEGTPEGELRATRLAIAQLEDAGAHGADASPEYQPALGGLKAAERGLAASMERARPSPEAAPAPTMNDANSLDAIQAATGIDTALLAQIRATGMAVADENAAQKVSLATRSANVGTGVGRV